MDRTRSSFEKVGMPDECFKIKSFTTPAFEHCITVHPHWHSEVEMLYVMSGSAVQQVNDRIFSVRAGDIVLIGRNQLHSTYSHQGEACEIMAVMFDKAALLGEADPDGPDVFENAMVFENPIQTEDETGRLLRACLTGIYDELTAHRPGCRYAVTARLHDMAALLIRSGLYHSEPAKSGALRFSRSMLENTFRLIDESYDQQIGIREAAAASNLSDSHFCRLFKATTGMTFKTYLTSYRVGKAEVMLQNRKSVTEAAMECGFGSVSSLIRNYKRFKNCTPSASRLRSD